MQQAAWATIQALQAAAATGDVAAAQVILGSSAPGLRASGLRRATFPTIAADGISVQREGELYVALAGDGRLTSIDGITWTFDYGDRPLAAYKSPGAEPVHDLWWGESDGEHHLFLQVTVATISRSGVTANVNWSFDPSRPDDATYFRLAGIVISTVALDGVDYSGHRRDRAHQRLHRVDAGWHVRRRGLRRAGAPARDHRRQSADPRRRPAPDRHQLDAHRPLISASYSGK